MGKVDWNIQVVTFMKGNSLTIKPKGSAYLLISEEGITKDSGYMTCNMVKEQSCKRMALSTKETSSKVISRALGFLISTKDSSFMKATSLMMLCMAKGSLSG